MVITPEITYGAGVVMPLPRLKQFSSVQSLWHRYLLHTKGCLNTTSNTLLHMLTGTQPLHTLYRHSAALGCIENYEGTSNTRAYTRGKVEKWMTTILQPFGDAPWEQLVSISCDHILHNLSSPWTTGQPVFRVHFASEERTWNLDLGKTCFLSSKSMGWEKRAMLDGWSRLESVNQWGAPVVGEYSALISLKYMQLL